MTKPALLSRRKLLRLTWASAGLSATSLTLAACTPTSTSAPAQPTSVTTPVPSPNPTDAPTSTPSAQTDTVTNTVAIEATTPPLTATVAVLSDEAPVGIESAETVAAMQTAAQAFLTGLSDKQRATATYTFDNPERWNWHWAVKQRNGIATADLDAKQIELGWALLRTGTTELGFSRMQNIIELQDREVGRSNGRYHFTVFGEPGAPRWGWRFEGNHISVNATIAGQHFTLTPLFQGVVPTTAKSGPRPGERVLDRLENAARELVLALAEPERKVAVFQPNSLTDLATGSKRNITPLPATGLAKSALTDPQLGLMSEVVNEYIAIMPTGMGQQQRAHYDNANPNDVYFGWAGSLEPNKPQYYRLQGPRFLLEFDNSRNSGTHVHSVWRDFAQDFGDQMRG